MDAGTTVADTVAAASSGEGPDHAAKQRIREAFDLFDDAANGTVPSEEVPTILRFLGVFPPEKDVPDILDSMYDEDPTKYVTYERFEAKALELLKSGTYAPDTEETLLAAFKVLDPEDTGEVDVERLQELLSKDGVSERGFRDKELDGFMAVAREGTSKTTISYEDYVAKLVASIEQTQILGFAAGGAGMGGAD